ncbi:MAG TPA: hypothetical protein VKU00_08865 [Chthonomonadaceae bacterium]|nr:hypothetical protein [Chthonomonadaceae bacterium]
MTIALLLLLAQGVLGACDTLYYHEYKLRLPAQPHARHELQLHAFRDFIYALLFGTIGWLTWNGLFAWLFLLLLLMEIVITLADFLEEDRTRKLPPGERVMHAIMGILYGLFLAYLLPNVFQWTHQATAFGYARYGLLSWLLTLMAGGVFVSGLRDYISAQRRAEWPALPGKKPVL